jgi:hypothetical protein
MPVFSLVLDRDINEDMALLYPELYKELTKVGNLATASVICQIYADVSFLCFTAV